MLTSNIVKKLAGEIGFDLCAVTLPVPLDTAKKRLSHWVEMGYQADMDWINRTLEKRLDPKMVLESVRSIIMLGLNYYTGNSDSVPGGHGRISRYARGKDYHRVMEKMSKKLIYKLKDYTESAGTERFYFYVDYGPFMERAYAKEAGLGFIGRNSMLINKVFGSWIFLGEILTSVELEPDNKDQTDHGDCGNCTLCIDSCPTGAIVEAGMIDSRRCLSFLTIENTDEIPDDIARGMSDNVFGCDICQEVCPFNASPVITKHEEFKPENGPGEFLDINRLFEIEGEDVFICFSAGSSLKRAGLAGLRRNARIVLNNVDGKPGEA